MDRHRSALLALSGAALVGSFATSLLGGVLHPVVDGRAHSVEALTAPSGTWPQLLIYVGALLLMLGLPAALAWLAPRCGWLGVVGMTTYFLGNALSAQAHLVVEGFVAPTLARHDASLIPADDSIVAAAPFQLLQVVGGLVLVAGLLLTGVALLRTAGVPRWVGAAALLGGVAVLVPVPQAPVVTGLQVELGRGLAVAGLGWLMLRAAGASRARTSGASGSGSASQALPRASAPAA